MRLALLDCIEPEVEVDQRQLEQLGGRPAKRLA
jgi:hypothetical protein